MLNNLFFESKAQFNTIIDKTLNEAYKDRKGISDKKLKELAVKLKSMGVSLFEVNSQVFSKLSDLPVDWFILGIEHNKDIELSIKSGIKGCVFNSDEMPDRAVIEKLKGSGADIYLEVRADCKKDAETSLKNLELFGLKYFNVIRFMGLLNYESISWESIIDKCHRLGFKVDLCPDNFFYTAISTAYDGIGDGTDSITTTFCGFGKTYRYAPLEELLISEIVLRESEVNCDLTILPDVTKLFCDITGEVIPDNKPVIGSSIFAVESGMHTHGLNKCSMTYEPYEPELVGQVRAVKIGKHSGRRSIERRLEELGLDSSKYNLADILEMVREKSIQLKRDLYDEDLIALIALR